jgi:hypothetical protein
MGAFQLSAWYRMHGGSFLSAVAGALFLCAALTSAPAAAADEKQPDLISLGAGYFDVLRSDSKDHSGDFRLEYRFGDLLTPGWTNWLAIRPWIGGEITTQRSLYGAGGLIFDIPIGSSFTLSPGIGAGLYSVGRGKDLGSVVEFRSTAELSYKFENNSRIALSFGHISNAGLGEQNPGAEIVTLYFHIPSNWLFGY